MNYDSRQINRKRKTFTENAFDESTKWSRTEDVSLSITIEFSDVDMSQYTQTISQDETQSI